jgi:WD40 repeat protein
MQRLGRLMLWLILFLSGVLIAVAAPRTWACSRTPLLAITTTQDGQIDLHWSNRQERWTLDGETPVTVTTTPESAYSQHVFTNVFQHLAILTDQAGLVQVVDVTSGAALSSFTFHAHNSVSLGAFNSDASAVLVGSLRDHYVEIHDVKTGTLLKSFNNFPDLLESFAISPDNQIVAAGNTSAAVHLWDSQSGQLLHTFYNRSNPVIIVQFSHDSQTLLTGDYPGTGQLWNVATGVIEGTFFAHQPIDLAAFSPDDRLLVASTFSGLYLWDRNMGQVRFWQPFRHQAHLQNLQFAPDGQHVLLILNNAPVVWDSRSGAFMRNLCPRILTDQVGFVGAVGAAFMLVIVVLGYLRKLSLDTRQDSKAYISF